MSKQTEHELRLVAGVMEKHLSNVRVVRAGMDRDAIVYDTPTSDGKRFGPLHDERDLARLVGAIGTIGIELHRTHWADGSTSTRFRRLVKTEWREGQTLKGNDPEVTYRAIVEALVAKEKGDA